MYSFEQKLEIVERCLQGESAQELADEYGVSSRNLVQTWVRTYRKEGAEGLRPKGKAPKSDSELKDERIQVLEAEVASLIKIAKPETATALEKTRVIADLRSTYPLPLLLAAAGLAKSTFSYNLKVLARPDKHAELRKRIIGIYEESGRSYGYRRITERLRSEGLVVNHKLVLKIMREEKISG
ncbi:MAG: IS3 family transposase [Corynebacterium sp.]|nr:IS3 family transposase [Corynebacterium sp.]